ncbi:MAG: hypothetical protein ABIO15_02045 [Terrimesophilobacter sp.]
MPELPLAPRSGASDMAGVLSWCPRSCSEWVITLVILNLVGRLAAGDEMALDSFEPLTLTARRLVVAAA